MHTTYRSESHTQILINEQIIIELHGLDEMQSHPLPISRLGHSGPHQLRWGDQISLWAEVESA